ncbi:MAG: hypothetical protein P4L35_08795, partial [Ignavibacteriaceae bacterium]|nr:hypothetical protein [Ignavibacteriaceae bacterium]
PIGPIGTAIPKPIIMPFIKSENSILPENTDNNWYLFKWISSLNYSYDNHYYCNNQQNMDISTQGIRTNNSH